MKLIEFGNHTCVVGLVWALPSSSSNVDKAEIKRRVFEETQLDSALGTVIPAQLDEGGKVIVRNSLGFTPKQDELESIPDRTILNSYPLAQIAANCHRSTISIVIFRLIDTQEETWWFSASINGVVIPGCDTYGSKDSVLLGLMDFWDEGKDIYIDIGGISLLCDASLEDASISSLKESFGNQVSFSLGSKEDLLPGIEVTEKIARILGVEQKRLNIFYAGLVVAVVALALYFSGFLDDLTPPDEMSQDTATSIEKRKMALALAKEKQVEAELSKEKRNIRFMQENLMDKKLTKLSTLLTQQHVDWVSDALNDVVYKLPFQTSGYELSTAECSSKKTCNLRWRSVSKYSDANAIKTLLGNYSDRYSVTNDYSAQWIEKKFPLEVKNPRIVKPENFVNLPVINYFLNSFIETLNGSKKAGLISDSEIFKPRVEPLFADLPDKRYKGLVLESSFVTGDFSITFPTPEYVPLFIDRFLKKYPYVGVHSLKITFNRNIETTIGGTYVASKK